MNVLESKVVNRFLDNFNGRTEANYKSQIKYFFEFIGKNPDEYITDTRLLENGDRIKKHNEYESDIKAYQKHLIENKKAPRTIRAIMNVVRVFFKRNRIQLDAVLWDELRDAGIGSAVLTEDRKPTKKELLKILAHGTVLDRAYILMLKDSGCRPIEACTILRSDYHDKEIPARLHIRPINAKTDQPRDVYISDESVTAIASWLDVKQEWLDTVASKCNLVMTVDGEKVKVIKKTDDDRLFPLTVEAIRYRWNSLLKRAGLTEKDKYTDTNILHLYTLRKYFRSNLGDADKAEALMGHINYYRRFSKEELKQAYLDNVKNLKVYGEYSADLEKRFDEKLKEKEARIKELEERIQTKNIAQEIVNNPQFRTEVMKLLHPIAKEAVQEIEKQGKKQGLE